VTARQPLYYGWVMVIVLAITETISYGVLFYAFTVFIKPMQAELGWSTGEITLGYSLSVAVSALFGVAQGRWLDRHGARLSMSVGSIGAALLVLGWSQVQTLPGYYALWFGIGIVKAMVLYEPAFWVVAAWFSRKRRLALTVMTFIAGFSSLIFTPLTQALLSRFGWRDTLLIYALLLGVATVLPHALLLRRRPADVGLHVDGDTAPATLATVNSQQSTAVALGYSARQVLRQPSFWWLTGAFTLNGIGVSALLVHLVPYLTEKGYDPAFAALIYGLLGAVSLPGRLILTPLGSRISPVGIVAGIFLTQAVGVFLLIGAGTPVIAVLFLLLFAGGYGAVTPARAALVGEFFGTAHYGAVSSVVALCVTLLSASSPTLVGFMRDSSGSYDAALVIVGICALLAVGAVILAAHSRQRETGAISPQSAGA
jgi:MFS family permease